MRPRPLLIALLLVPVLVLAGWFVYEGWPTWTRNTPAWLVPSNPDAVLGACEVETTVRTYDVSFIGGSPAVSSTEARALANEFVGQSYDLPAGDYVVAQGPALVRATFPNVGARAAWLNLAILEEAGTDGLGKVAVLYLDAETGELLSLVTGAVASDPLTACGGGPVSRRALLRQYLPLVLLAGYVVLVVVGFFTLRLLKRRTHSPERLP